MVSSRCRFSAGPRIPGIGPVALYHLLQHLEAQVPSSGRGSAGCLAQATVVLPRPAQQRDGDEIVHAERGAVRL